MLKPQPLFAIITGRLNPRQVRRPAIDASIVLKAFG
jgi:hypothetical protein